MKVHPKKLTAFLGPKMMGLGKGDSFINMAMFGIYLGNLQ